MQISILEKDFNRETYNATVGHPLQTWEWGEARERMGTKIVRFGISADGAFKQGYLMTIHPIPHTGFQIGYIPRSPLPDAVFLDYLLSYAKDNNLLFIKIEPDVDKTDAASEEMSHLQTHLPLQESPHQLFPDWTMVLDLAKPEEQLLNELKQKTRYNIRLASKKGVTIREENTPEGFEIFTNLYFETTKRQKYFGHDKHYHQVVWESLKDSMATILVAYFENTPIAAYELFLFKNKLYYPYGGSSDLHRNVMGANLLMWEAIRYGVQKGATVFDMWGAAAPTAESDNSFNGFTRFKEGYNAYHVQKIGSFDLVVNPTLYSVYNLSHKLRSLYLTFKAG